MAGYRRTLSTALPQRRTRPWGSSPALLSETEVDKGYPSKALLERLWQRGFHLITSIRRNMKNYLMPLLDKLLLRKRFIIEALFNKLKSGMGLQHTRHRSPINALVHIVSCLAAYTLAQPKGTIANSGHIPIPNCSSLP